MGNRLAIAALAAMLLAGCASKTEPPPNREELALMTTLPIYWGESASIAEALSNTAPPHWVRTEIEKTFELVPVDTLSEDALDGVENLLLAQPRALSAPENVALDQWVREGGQLLLFADPLLTEHSRFAIGDRRRPQDVVLLSPILARWGLELRFDESQPGGLRTISADGMDIPVELAGHFESIATDAPASCALSGGGLLAQCRIGEGRVTIVADAALLDAERDQADALGALAARSFD